MLKKLIFISILTIVLLGWSLPVLADESATDQVENILSAWGAKTPGDILWHCPVELYGPPNDSDNQIVGCEYDGQYIYLTGGGGSYHPDPNKVHIWQRVGSSCQWVCTVNQPTGTGWGWRDIAYDGTYLYASDDRVLDAWTATCSGVSTYPASTITLAAGQMTDISVIRAVAYDEDHDWFWTANFSSNIYAFNRAGNMVAGPYANTLALYGMAYDNRCPGGPYLWLHAQDSTNVYQWSTVTHSLTGLVYSGWGDDDPGVSGIAGGLCVYEGIPSEQNSVVLLGVTQCFPRDEIYAIEVCQLPIDSFSVLPGVDLWSTPCGGATVDSHFTVMPLPPGFFGPGSDPFAGDVAFKGEPLTTTPPGILGPADAIVERKIVAPLPVCGDSFTVPIEIVALSLVSIQPITVTYYGGGSPELWDVKACLSSTQPQNIGWMIIRRECDAGGTFSSTLPVTPKFVFIRQSDQAQRVLDMGGMLTIDFETERLCKGQWTYSDPGFGIFTSPGGLTVDHDCNPSTPEVPVGASSNFFPGVRAIPCNCSQPAQEYKKRMTHEEAQLAAHGVLPPEQQQHDRDNDCIHDTADNCPDIPNPYQTDSDCDGIGDACEVKCGDVNNDGVVNLGDVVYLISYLYKGGPVPVPSLCVGDVNNDNAVALGDLVYLISYLYKLGPAPDPNCCNPPWK